MSYYFLDPRKGADLDIPREEWVNRTLQEWAARGPLKEIPLTERRFLRGVARATLAARCHESICNRINGHTGPHIKTGAGLGVSRVWHARHELMSTRYTEVSMAEDTDTLHLARVDDPAAPPHEVKILARGHSVLLIVDATGTTGLYSKAHEAVRLLAPGWSVEKVTQLLTHFAPTGVDDHLLTWVGGPPKQVELSAYNRQEQRELCAIMDREWKVIPTTQKAKGMVALADWGKSTVPSFTIAQDSADIPLSLDFPRFVRPCPPVPNHGGVESRLVTTHEGVREVLAEAQAAIPGSELIIAQPIDAVANLVYTPNVLTLGPGHDGATSGRGAVSLGLVRTLNVDTLPLEEAGITQEPYVEAVMQRAGDKLSVLWTQLRNGPEIPAAQDYVPEETTVQAVVDAEGDLLEWAERVKAFTPGTVVVGTGLGSHYAVHCIQKGVPFVTTHRPTVGEILPKSDIAPLDPQAVREGLILAQKTTLRPNEAADALRFGLLALHAFATAPEMGLNGVSVGYGLGVMMRVAFALGCGEWRYCKSNKVVEYGSESVTVSAAPWKGEERNTAYAQFLAKPWPAQRAFAQKATEAFRFGTFGGGYGGQKWHDCMRANWKVESAARQIIRNPCKETVATFLEAANAMVHKAHNGGWWFNKLLTKTDLDNAAAADPRTVVNLSAAIWQMLERRKDLGAGKLKKSGWPLMAPIPQFILDWKPAVTEAPPAAKSDVPLPWGNLTLAAQIRHCSDTHKVRFQSKVMVGNVILYSTETDWIVTKEVYTFVQNLAKTSVSYANSGMMYAPVPLAAGSTLDCITFGDDLTGWPALLLEKCHAYAQAQHTFKVDPTTGSLKEKAASSSTHGSSYYEEEGEWAYV